MYTARSAGYLIGALFGCLLFRFLRRELSLAILYMLIGAALLVLALTRSLVLAAVVMAAQGLCTGICDSATNVMLCLTWKDKASPYIQALYFFFGVGCTIAPLIVAPFLSADRFRIPFYITSALLFAAGAALLPLAMVRRSRPEQEHGTHGDDSAALTTTTRTSAPRLKDLLLWWSQRENRSVLLVVLLVALMITAYSGMEIVYWQYIPTYLNKIPLLNISEERASYMTAAVNYAFTLLRGLAIFLVWKIKPAAMILISLAAVVIACALLLYSNTIGTVWAGNVLIGAAFSVIYPQIYAYATSKITINNYIGSVFVFCSGFMAVVYPVIIGASMDVAGRHNALIWLVLGSVLVTLVSFIVLLSLDKLLNRRTSRAAAIEDDYEMPSRVTRL